MGIATKLAEMLKLQSSILLSVEKEPSTYVCIAKKQPVQLSIVRFKCYWF